MRDRTRICLEQMTRERDTLRAENASLREVVDAARAYRNSFGVYRKAELFKAVDEYDARHDASKESKKPYAELKDGHGWSGRHNLTASVGDKEGESGLKRCPGCGFGIPEHADVCGECACEEEGE